MALPKYKYIALERQGNIFIITLQRPPENRLTCAFCHEIISAFHTVQRMLGPDSEGAVITRGSDTKFWCTVCPLAWSIL
jgi:enoyl-CoA hydratase/carnithine racemase